MAFLPSAEGPPVCEAIKSFLARQGIIIAAALKHLGFWLGPRGGAAVWTAPVERWLKTAYGIGSSMRSPAMVTTVRPSTHWRVSP